MEERSGSWLHSLSQSTSEVQLAWEEGCLPSSPLPPPQVDGNVATSYNLLWGTLFPVAAGAWYQDACGGLGRLLRKMTSFLCSLDSAVDHF